MRSSRVAMGVAVTTLALLCSCGTSPRGDIGAESSSLAVGASTDPLAHLQVIAAPAMEGRGTGTPGLQRATDYIAEQCRTAGLTGAFVGAANPYHQAFSVGGWPIAPPGLHEHDPEAEDSAELGSDLFEHGLFVGGDLAVETKKEMQDRVCTTWMASALPCPEHDDPREVITRATATGNIVGMFPGSGAHRSEVILLSAHLDHLGKGFLGTFLGADDNGSGSAGLVAIMHRVAEARRAQPIDRTIAFLWTSGEEKGLLGAAYFVDNAPASLPLRSIKQLVNLDMIGRWDDTRFSVGDDRTAGSQAFGRALDAENRRLERPFVRINRDIQQYERRQDGFAFSRRGIPAVFVFEGLSRAEGGGGMMPHYHKTSDTIEALLQENGGSKLRRVTDLVARTVLAQANAP